MQNKTNETPQAGGFRLWHDMRTLLFVVGSIVAFINMVSLVVGFFAGTRWARHHGGTVPQRPAAPVETTGLPVEDAELEDAAEAWDRDSGAV